MAEKIMRTAGVRTVLSSTPSHAYCSSRRWRDPGGWRGCRADDDAERSDLQRKLIRALVPTAAGGEKTWLLSQRTPQLYLQCLGLAWDFSRTLVGLRCDLR